MWPAIDYTIAYKLGADYTSELSAAWRNIFNFITIKMSEGMTQDPATPVLLSKQLTGQKDSVINSSSEASLAPETKLDRSDDGIETIET